MNNKRLQSSDYENLGDDVLLTSHQYILDLKKEVNFIKGEIARCKLKLIHSKSAKLTLTLSQQYKILLSCLSDCQSKMPILYMAAYTPLTKLLNFQENQKNILIIEEETQEISNSDDIGDVSHYYKPYED
jgi:hypothetical protein